jgi:hypothetical protein
MAQESAASTEQTAITDLAAQSVFTYDQAVFFEAVNEAYSRWRENANYARRVAASDAPDRITAFEDLYALPTVDMREFKQHPRELLIDPATTGDELAVFSSGTTADTRSFAARSEDGAARQADMMARFARTALPDIDHISCLIPPKDETDRLSVERSNRALFRYSEWLFSQFERSFCADITADGGLTPDFAALKQQVVAQDGTQAIFGSPAVVEQFCHYLEANDEILNLGDNGAVVTGGGWKGVDDTSPAVFRERLHRRLNVAPDHHTDWYGCSELFFFSGNRVGDANPDEKRVSCQGFGYVADETHFRQTGELEPVANGEPGILIVIDAVNTDYPGVILTDDVVMKTGGTYGEDVRIEYIERSTL